MCCATSRNGSVNDKSDLNEMAAIHTYYTTIATVARIRFLGTLSLTLCPLQFQFELIFVFTVTPFLATVLRHIYNLQKYYNTTILPYAKCCSKGAKLDGTTGLVFHLATRLRSQNLSFRTDVILNVSLGESNMLNTFCINETSEALNGIFLVVQTYLSLIVFALCNSTSTKCIRN